MSSSSIPFTRDLGRKLLALLLALLIWWRVYLGIQKEQSVEFTIVTSLSATTAQDVIVIHEPDGWQLVDPASGSRRTIVFKGVTSDLEAYFREGVRAHVIANTSDASAGTFTQSVRLEDLDWPDSTRARAFLSGGSGQEQLELLFEELESLPVQLSTDFIPVEENLPEGFVLAIDEAYFSPSSVTVEGPFNAIEELTQVGVENFGLFKEVSLRGEGNTVQARIELTEKAIAEGLSLKEEGVEIRVPVYPEQVQPFLFSPTSEIIQLWGDAPEDAPGAWAINEYRGRGFTVRYRHDPLIDPIPDERSLRESILFFVNLADLPSGAVNGEVMTLEWVIRDPSGLDDTARLQALKRAITLVPFDSDDPDVRSVTLTLP